MKGPTPIERVQWESCPCDNSRYPYGMFSLCPECGFLFTDRTLITTTPYEIITNS